jgi:hypothetical protein
MPSTRWTRPRPAWARAWVLTAAVLAAIWLAPTSWWERLWPDGRLRGVGAPAPAPPLVIQRVEIVTPPAVVEPVPADQPEAPRPEPEPRWWTDAWNARIVADRASQRAAAADSLLPGPLRDLFGAQATVAMILATPDSVVTARVWRLVQQEQLSASDADGIFEAIARARAYADLRSREAAMFDEFLHETVPVPR